MKKNIDKPRNFVKKHADEFTKPSRHRDRKNDYARGNKHRKRSDEGAEVHARSSKREREEYVRSNKDWSYDPDYIEDGDFWVQPDEDTPPTGEV